MDSEVDGKGSDCDELGLLDEDVVDEADLENDADVDGDSLSEGECDDVSEVELLCVSDREGVSVCEGVGTLRLFVTDKK